MEKRLLTITILLMLCAPAAAEWNLDGFPLHTIKHGTVEGGIYIDGGHGRVFTTSYTQNFTVPNGTIKWARLYVSAKDTTWINTSINGHLLGNYTDPVNHPEVYTSYKADRSMCWAYYDNVTDWIVNGHNTATAKLGTRVDLYTKSWGMVLLVVYEGGDDPILLEYWVNEGNPLLHGNHLPFSTYHNTTDTSFTGIADLNNVTSADLWTVYIWGSEESEGQQHDTLWFNSELIAEDASDGAGIDFGILAPGWQSYLQQLTINNTGSGGIIVTAGVTDTANNLYNDGLLFDSDKWSAYTELIMKGEAIDTNVMLDVPGEYTGFGILNGTLILWAETI